MHWAVIVAAVLGAGVGSEPTGAFDVGDQAQLFVDQLLVRSAENVCFPLHSGHEAPGQSAAQSRSALGRLARFDLWQRDLRPG